MTAARFLFALGGFALLAASAARAEDPDALWKLISTRCLPNAQAGQPPAPCVAVDIEGGVAHGTVVLKDRNGATQFLLMPTAKIPGMESPEILAPDAANYFAVAWAQHWRMDQAAGRAFPRDTLSLAINAMSGRSQNQLHVHIDCIDAGVRAAVHDNLASVGPHWAPFPQALMGHRYLAMRLDGEDFGGINPLRLVADGVPGAAADMGHQTLVAVGVTQADGRPGFVLLTDHADLPGDTASGEELQDHACRGV